MSYWGLTDTVWFASRSEKLRLSNRAFQKIRKQWRLEVHDRSALRSDQYSLFQVLPLMLREFTCELVGIHRCHHQSQIAVCQPHAITESDLTSI
jgi:hypothetical protein